MIVKNGRAINLGGLNRRISLIRPKPRSLTPMLWKIAFFGGAYGDGEYIRQSSGSSIFVESSSGDDNYIEEASPTIFISYMPPQFGEGVYVYYSDDNAVTWVPEGAIEVPDLNPAPSVALSYSQSSYIQTIVLGGADPDQTGTYTWDGTTFVNGKPKYIGPRTTNNPNYESPFNNDIHYEPNESRYVLNGWKTNNEEMMILSSSIDLASNWGVVEGSSEPIVNSIVYTDVCPDLTARLWIYGVNGVWNFGPRTLTRVADRHYVYIGGDEVVKHNGTAWEYYYERPIDGKVVIETVTGNQPWPWLVPWVAFTAQKLCLPPVYPAYRGGDTIYYIGDRVSHGGGNYVCIYNAGSTGYGPFGGYLDGTGPANGIIYWLPE